MEDLIFLHGRHNPRCTHTIAKHWIGYHGIQFIVAGKITLSYDSQVHDLDAPICWPTFPGPWITWHGAPGCTNWNHRYVAFTGNLVPRWAAAGLIPTGPVVPTDVPLLTRCFDELLPLITANDRWTSRKAVNLLERILIEIASAASTSNEPASWLSMVLDRVNDPAGSYSLRHLARQCGMSEVSLRRKFRAATGQSLHAYALGVRIAEARRRLIETDDALKVIADELGYRDVFYFSRQFKSLTGLPPATFRASRRTG